MKIDLLERTISTGFDRSLSIFTDVVDCVAGLFIDEIGELLAILGRPCLLVATLVTPVVRDRFGRVAPLSDVLGEVPLTDGQP